MRKLLLGLFALGSISAMADVVSQMPKLDEGIFEEAKEIATRTVEQQQVDLARLYRKYDLDPAQTYAVTKLKSDFVYGEEVICGVHQFLIGESPEELGFQYWTSAYLDPEMKIYQAVLLHTIKGDAKRFQLYAMCRNEAMEARKTIDSLIITKDAVIERNPFQRPGRSSTTDSWNHGSSLMLKFNLPK
jgi:hypothetical protein